MKSTYGDRDTIGTQYLEAQKQDLKGVTLGDVNLDFVDSLIEDLNNSIKRNPFEGRDYYINVVEERDLLMPNTFKRRMFLSLYRPYPEDNTLVLKTSPKTDQTFFCWDLPHHSELPNILINSHTYDQEYISKIKMFLNGDLTEFGFVKVSMNSSLVEGYDEKTIKAYKKAYWNYCETLEMDPKSIRSEKRLGFFWVPNKNFQDQELTNKKKSFHLLSI